MEQTSVPLHSFKAPTAQESIACSNSKGNEPNETRGKESPNDKEVKNPDTEASVDRDPLRRLDTAEVTVTAVGDDSTLNPWTFRMFFIGLSAFGAVLQEIFYFKPQIIFVSVMFLTVISYAMGEFMAFAIPRWGAFGRFLNPGPFNIKEHTASIIMASAASVNALSTEAIAAQKLYYGGYPNQGGAICLATFVPVQAVLHSRRTLLTQFFTVMRNTLLFPTKMLYPANLPITTVLETLHKDKSESPKRMKVFWILFGCILIWELLPEYIFPLLIGISVFCLSKQDNLTFTNLFGGAQGNEGLGLLSICLDWNYVAGYGSPLWVPLQTLTNSLIGVLSCMVIFTAVYFTNTWRSQSFPLLSQQLYNGSSNSSHHRTYNITAILNPDLTINDHLVEQVGTPWLAGTYVVFLIANNAGFTANLVHMFLWNYKDIKSGWTMLTIRDLRKILSPSTYMFWKHKGERTEEEKVRIRNNPDIDPHCKVMLEYKDVPDTWYFVAFAISLIVALVSLELMRSTVSATIAGNIFPGRPLANMYFTLYTFNAVQQGQYLLRDLKLAQHTKLSPRCTFTTQMIGCIFGACLNYLIMYSVVKNQAAILVSIEGSSIWSGVQIQHFNSAAIAWSIAPKMFSFGARYYWVGASYFIGLLIPFPFYICWKITGRRVFSYLNFSIIVWYCGYLFIGVNSSTTSYFLVGFFGQFYLRKYQPRYFAKWNYLVSAALDGGTQVMVFLLSFAVAGAGGVARPFPAWAGNHNDNVDYCKHNTANHN
ncbi:Oligopeptide transporter 3 [Hyphodiscus hymeniophilus]|uniref:Oligopeptide transporter 3 n=1 Tax=Hyphodiscus hymeniophilus TaxID=353542 RepID=A0A9P7AYR3_9HELO|nr:Oligopeptide transporter 3 [Hyphodiscus hymeniophilus]